MATDKPQKDTVTDTKISAPLTERELSQYLAKVRGVVFSVGFNRSGSSLIGDLITAHPNIVMSNEARVIGRYAEGEFNTRESLFSFIIKKNMAKGIRKNFVAGQYQDRYDTDIEIIGDKHSPNNTMQLAKEGFNTLAKLKEFIKLPIKFIFTVRNPYDMVSSMVTNIPDWHLTSDEKIEEAILYFKKISKKNMALITQVPANQIFTVRHEAMVAAPEKMLADICDFLGVVKTPDYLSDCAAVTYKVPNKSRDRLNWDLKSREKIDTLIEEYAFFSGYSWDV